MLAKKTDIRDESGPYRPLSSSRFAQLVGQRVQVGVGEDVSECEERLLAAGALGEPLVGDRHLHQPASSNPHRPSAAGEPGAGHHPVLWSVGDPAHRVTAAYRATKRAMDAVGAGLLLLVLSPVLLVVAIAVKWSSAGPVIYRQQRLGRGGAHFTMLKFRTMVADADQCLHRNGLYERYVDSGYKLHPTEECRHTSIGAFLRRTSLDELPQLWNVLRGHMSLVGPRPVVPKEIALYGNLAHSYLAVRPGLTGLWQVSGRSAIGYPERCHIDLRYFEQRSVVTDLSILLRTPWVVLRGIGAH